MSSSPPGCSPRSGTSSPGPSATCRRSWSPTRTPTGSPARRCTGGWRQQDARRSNRTSSPDDRRCAPSTATSPRSSDGCEPTTPSRLPSHRGRSTTSSSAPPTSATGRTLAVATAASVDGYTSFGASITKDGFKQTLTCPAPRAVLADLDVLTAAPAIMTASGYGDLLGKVPAGADWEVVPGLVELEVAVPRLSPAVR